MRVLLALLFCMLALPAGAEPGTMCTTEKWGHRHCIRPAHFAYDTCNAIATFSARHGLDTGFFARLIWQESRFDANALSHANARGIAQFIPSTAALRGLEDPYNPADALEHAAQYLAEMVARFGNEGLAAIGYNGGERRARGFLQGRGLAPETVAYVPIITGLKAEAWRDDPPEAHDMALETGKPFLPACYALAAGRRITPLKRPEAPVATPAPDTLMRWGVQVAFAQSKSAAHAAAERKTRACRPLVRGRATATVYKPHRVASKPGYFFAQYGATDRGDAAALCTAMRARGCSCRVLENVKR